MLHPSNLEQALTGFFPTKTELFFTDEARPSREFEDMKTHLVSTYNHRVLRWFRAMELYDRETITHTIRVVALSLEFGRSIGLKKDTLNCIQYGTLLHDIGKMGIPDSIMGAPRKLSNAEFEIVKKHPVYADEWITDWAGCESARSIPLFHHERWDGCGYPRRLKGMDIPYLARMVAIVDAFDALTSDRPYRKAMPKAKAVRIIKSESGTHFDPELVNAFLDLRLEQQRFVPHLSMLV